MEHDQKCKVAVWLGSILKIRLGQWREVHLQLMHTTFPYIRHMRINSNANSLHCFRTPPLPPTNVRTRYIQRRVAKEKGR